MADIHTTEARIENRVMYPDTALMTFNRAQKEVLQQHGVSKEKFRETYEFYLQNLQHMDKLYEIIIDTLSTRESKAKALQKQVQIEE